MLINTELLFSFGGNIHTFNTNETIFLVEETPKYYYQIVSGDVKLNHTDEDGRELIQSLLTDGESVCELLLFVDEKYPVNAVAMSECTIIKVAKEDFIRMLKEHRPVSEDVQKYISKTLYQKFIMMRNISSPSAEKRIMGTLQYFKSFSNDKTKYSYEVKLTRQQFACITGLRTETVIRYMKKLESEKVVRIERGKVFY
jgi:CRP-like cAMP-binding protein